MPGGVFGDTLKYLLSRGEQRSVGSRLIAKGGYTSPGTTPVKTGMDEYLAKQGRRIIGVIARVKRDGGSHHRGCPKFNGVPYSLPLLPSVTWLTRYGSTDRVTPGERVIKRPLEPTRQSRRPYPPHTQFVFKVVFVLRLVSRSAKRRARSAFTIA